MTLVRWMKQGSIFPDDPLPSAVTELNVTLLEYTSGDRSRMRMYWAILDAAASGHYEKMRTFVYCMSAENRQLFERALRQHDLVLWSTQFNRALIPQPIYSKNGVKKMPSIIRTSKLRPEKIVAPGLAAIPHEKALPEIAALLGACFASDPEQASVLNTVEQLRLGNEKAAADEFFKLGGVSRGLLKLCFEFFGLGLTTAEI